MSLHPSEIARQFEQSQRRAEAMRREPNPYYRNLLKGAALVLFILAFFVFLIALAAMLGVPK